MTTTDLSTTTERIQASNGEPIALTRFAPSTGTARGAVLIAPAMATKASFYRTFAQWLTTRGLVAYTFDYQGYGESATTSLRHVEADICTWAADAAVVLDHVLERESVLPVQWIGHSLGGQVLPFARHDRLERATIVASGTGYWGHSEGPNRVLAPVLWYALAPTLTRAYGYYPGKRFKLLGDLPAPVMRQWTTWCKNPDYLLGVVPEARDRFASVTIPLTSISFVDDETMSDSATSHLESWYVGTHLERRRLVPRDLGVPRVGHMGLFRGDRAQIWPAVFDWLTA